MAKKEEINYRKWTLDLDTPPEKIKNAFERCLAQTAFGKLQEQKSTSTFSVHYSVYQFLEKHVSLLLWKGFEYKVTFRGNSIMAYEIL